MDKDNDTPSPTSNRPIAPTPMPTAAADVQAASPTAVALLMMNQQNVQLVLTLAAELELDTQALIDLLLAGTASSFALQALRGAVTPQNAEHLSTLQVIDMDLFDQAVRSLGVATPRISARAIEGARDLPEAARLASGAARSQVSAQRISGAIHAHTVVPAQRGTHHVRDNHFRKEHA